MTPTQLGEYGEEMAVLHLLKRGFIILDRNWFFGKNEIDIVCQRHDKELVVVEVKARNSDFFGDPQSFVSPGKQKAIIKVADAYILEKNLDVEVRFDIIAVLKNSKEERLEHFEDAFYFF